MHKQIKIIKKVLRGINVINMKILVYTLILAFATIHDANAQDIEIGFKNEYTFKKYLNLQITAKHGVNIYYDQNHINAALAIVEINRDGRIINSRFESNSQNETFNQMIDDLSRSTSGFWEVNFEPGFKDRYFVIIPFVQKVYSNDVNSSDTAWKEYLDLLDRTKEKYENLNFNSFEECKIGNCHITEIFIHNIGPRTY